jgi:hypothetical protein
MTGGRWEHAWFAIAAGEANGRVRQAQLWQHCLGEAVVMHWLVRWSGGPRCLVVVRADSRGTGDGSQRRARQVASVGAQADVAEPA